MRLFVGVWPPPDVLATLGALPRPEHPAVRWTPHEQWHVTLRFLGEVADEEVPGLVEALVAVGRTCSAGQAVAGPATRRLGPGALVVPVAGVDHLAEAVRAATGFVGAPPEGRPFAGHLTVARGRGARRIPRGLEGQPISATWLVDELALVRSRLDHHGSRYETLVTVPVGSSVGDGGA